MKQKRHTSIPALVTAAITAAGGVTKLAATVPVVHNNAAAIQALVDEIMQAGEAYRAGKKLLGDRRVELADILDKSRIHLMLTRDTYKSRLGKEHGPGWIITGWEESFEVSRKANRVLPHMQTLQTLMETDPGFETPTLNVTAAEFDMLHTKLSNALVAVNEQNTVVGNLKAARNQSRRKLDRLLRGLFQELRNFLTPLDERWKTYGFNIPGAPSTPEVPTNVTAVLIGPNAVSVKWARSERADHYRVSMRVIGVHPEMVSAGLPADLDFTLVGLPANSQIEIAVSAINAGGESVKSELVKVTTA